MKYLVLDLETGCKEAHGRKGNPWYNNIVAIGLKYNNKNESRYIEDYLTNLRIFNEHLYFWLENIDIIIGHNIKYDLLYLWKYKEFQNWLQKGGKIFDTQLAEYMISGQRHKYPALRDIAVNKYGCKEREKLMENYWTKGIDTKEIPKQLVLTDVTNDVLDTEQVMLQQVQILKQEGMYNLAMEQMEGLLATTEMEYNGCYINPEIFNTNKHKYEEKLLENIETLKEIAYRYWINIDLNFSSPKQISTLLFGGPIKVNNQIPVTNEFGLHQQIKSGPNKGQYKYKKVVQETRIKGFGLKPLSGWETKTEHIYKTDDQVLKSLLTSLLTIKSKTIKNITLWADVNIFIRALLEYREISKILGTYYEGTEKYIYNDSCVHQQLCHCGYEKGIGIGGGTGTGRLSCTSPNMQNQPS